MSFSTLQNQTTWKGLLTLSKTSKFISLSCLLWWLYVLFFSTNDKYKACSFALVIELSSIFVVKLNNAVAATRFHHFWWILRYFLCPLTHCHINVLWASIWGSVSRNLSISNPIYVVYNLCMHVVHACMCTGMCSESSSSSNATPYLYQLGPAVQPRVVITDPDSGK